MIQSILQTFLTVSNTTLGCLFHSQVVITTTPMKLLNRSQKRSFSWQKRMSEKYKFLCEEKRTTHNLQFDWNNNNTSDFNNIHSSQNFSISLLSVVTIGVSFTPHFCSNISRVISTVLREAPHRLRAK